MSRGKSIATKIIQLTMPNRKPQVMEPGQLLSLDDIKPYYRRKLKKFMEIEAQIHTRWNKAIQPVVATCSLTRWAIKRDTTTRLDGRRVYLEGNGLHTRLFRTKRECQAFIKEKYGYTRTRKDLRAEPHCWRMPKAVRVQVEVRETKKGK